MKLLYIVDFVSDWVDEFSCFVYSVSVPDDGWGKNDGKNDLKIHRDWYTPTLVRITEKMTGIVIDGKREWAHKGWANETDKSFQNHYIVKEFLHVCVKYAMVSSEEGWLSS